MQVTADGLGAACAEAEVVFLGSPRVGPTDERDGLPAKRTQRDALGHLVENVAIFVSMLAGACVTTGTYDRKVAELTRLRDADATAGKLREDALSAQLQKAEKSYAEQQAQLLAVQAALEKANADKVAGHTDDVPIRTSQFPSNWELSTRRAVEVVHFLIAQGMRPRVLAAAGYGEFDPAVPNDSPEHRAQNRRIEIVLQPNLSDLPPLDDASVAAAPRSAPTK